jgi:hypothetical protein
MQVGDLVRVVYKILNRGTLGLIVRIEEAADATWVHLHTGESFKIDKLEVVSESR